MKDIKSVDKYVENVDIPEFIPEKNPGELVEEKTQIPLGREGKDRLHNLDERERCEVLHFTPTGELLGELLRRSEEYEKTITNITKLIDSMKIWA